MKKIILIGFMGVGKSTIGKKLANRLNVPFIDSDQEIEKRHGKTIGELFSEGGESHFRTIETNFIKSFQDQDEFVLATGGGMPCFGNNMELLQQLGCTVYLSRPAKELTNRLIHAKAKRPLIAGMDEGELLSFVENKLGEREEVYRKSDIIAERDDQEVGTLIDLIHHRQLLQKS